MNFFFVLLSIFSGIGILILFFRLFFADLDDFVEALRYLITPDCICLLRGERAEDTWYTLKLLLYLGSGIGSAIAVWKLLHWVKDLF